jgi:hypothetical protein
MTRLLAGAALILLPFGCGHSAYHEAKADYHEGKAEYHHERASEDWEHGHPIGAAKQKIKEGHEEHKADRERLYE